MSLRYLELKFFFFFLLKYKSITFWLFFFFLNFLSHLILLSLFCQFSVPRHSSKSFFPLTIFSSRFKRKVWVKWLRKIWVIFKCSYKISATFIPRTQTSLKKHLILSSNAENILIGHLKVQKKSLQTFLSCENSFFAQHLVHYNDYILGYAPYSQISETI